MKPGKTRIKDIASALGLSTATVSRALTSKGLVAEPTLSLIRDKAAEMNYRPNVQARSLRTQRSMSVLLVVREIGNPFYLEVFKGAETRARAANYSILMGNTENDPAREAEYFEMLRDGHADGMILMTGSVPADWRGPYENVVIALEMVEGTRMSQILIDNVKAVDQAIDYLTGLGHTKIATITGPVGEGMSEKRLSGFSAAMARHRLQVPENYVQRGDYHFDEAVSATRTLLALPERPTAIFAANDEMAFGVLNEAQSQGLNVPDDLSVVGFDDIYLSRAVYPPLTTISQPRTEIGRRAMDVLLSQLDGGDIFTSVKIPTRLVQRATTAPPNHNS